MPSKAPIASNGDTDQRHHLTHLYLIDEEDRPHFAALGVGADFQLSPSSTDPDYADTISFYIGDRADDLLPSFDMLDRNADELSPFVKM